MIRSAGLAVILGATAVNALADDWESWRDGRRVLVVRLASADDERGRQQAAALAASSEDWQTRDVAIVWWEGGKDPAEWPAGGWIISAGAMARRFPVLQPSEWRVALIGRDGGVKAVWDRVVPAAEIFALIDAMPMGRREKEARERKAR